MENNNGKFKLIDLFKNKRYYAILNLTFYSLLILGLIVVIRINDSGASSSINNNQTSINNLVIANEFEKIKNKNFEFEYSLIKDDENIVYSGKQFQHKISFKDVTNQKEFAAQNNLFLEKQDDKFVLNEFKTDYFNYFDIELIEKLLSKVVKDESDYIISLKDFLEILGKPNRNDITDDLDIFLEITKEENKSLILKFDITPFVNLDDKNINQVILNLEYKNLGLVQDFEIK